MVKADISTRETADFAAREEVVPVDPIPVSDTLYDRDPDYQRNLETIVALKASLEQLHAADAPIDPNLAPHRMWTFVVNGLLVDGKWGVAKWALPQLASAFPESSYYSTMQGILERVPGYADTVMRDKWWAPVQIIPRGGADTVLLAFTSQLQLMMPTNIAHKWLERLGVHIAYVRSRKLSTYSRGAEAFGTTYEETLDVLRDAVVRLGARRVLCLGTSLGGYGAIRFGIDLGAEAVLVYSPVTHFPEDRLDEVFKNAVQFGYPDITRNEFRDYDLRRHIAAVAARPRIRIVFGADHEDDRRGALWLEGLPNITLEPVPNLAEHNSLVRSLFDGRFEAQLAELAGFEPFD